MAKTTPSRIDMTSLSMTSTPVMTEIPVNEDMLVIDINSIKNAVRNIFRYKYIPNEQKRNIKNIIQLAVSLNSIIAAKPVYDKSD